MNMNKMFGTKKKKPLSHKLLVTLYLLKMKKIQETVNN